MSFSGSGAMQGAASGAMLGAALAAPTGGISVPVGALLGALGGVGMGFFGGDEGPNIDISAEMGRIDALYNQAREQGSAVITRDFQAQRGELAQSQAARGILRSGVSQLGLARLGAAREQALGSFNADISARQAGTQSSLLNALMGRRFDSQTAAADRNRQGINQMLGAATGVAGAYAKSLPSTPTTTPLSGGTNYAGGTFVAPRQQFLIGEGMSQGTPFPSYNGFVQPQVNAPLPNFGGGGGTPYF